TAVEALKEGASDYLPKPLIMDELRHLMTRLMERRFLRREVNALRSRLGEQLAVNELVGSSPAMQRIKDVIGKVAVTDSPVLIEGESGTGKELVAAAIPSGQAPPGAPGNGGASGRVDEGVHRERAGHRRHEPEPGGGGQGRQPAAGSLLPAERRPGPDAAAQGAQGRPVGADRSLPA